MTRKRVRESIGRTLCEPCPYCEGKGYVKEPTTVAYEIFRELHREMGSRQLPDRKVTLLVNPDVASLLYDEERGSIEEFEQAYDKQIVINPRPGFHREQYEVVAA